MKLLEQFTYKEFLKKMKHSMKKRKAEKIGIYEIIVLDSEFPFIHKSLTIFY